MRRLNLRKRTEIWKERNKDVKTNLSKEPLNKDCGS